ncbi:MAG: hypothetical protein RL885_12995 [Planctomycetota bacterium]
MDRAFEVFQAALNCHPEQVSNAGALGGLLSDKARTFSIDLGGVRLAFLDTRTRRDRFDADRPRFAPASWLGLVREWLRDGPGVRILFLSQPLIERKVNWFRRLTHTMGDVNLPDYEKDFAALWEAICEAPGDVLIVSGDIHWSRLYQVKRASSRNEVFEAIASPLALIPGNLQDRGESSGKVDWNRPRGRASWARRYAINEPATYSTIELRTLQSGVSPDVRVSINAWGRPGGLNTSARPLASSSFTLRGRLS